MIEIIKGARLGRGLYNFCCDWELEKWAVAEMARECELTYLAYTKGRVLSNFNQH